MSDIREVYSGIEGDKARYSVPRLNPHTKYENPQHTLAYQNAAAWVVGIIMAGLVLGALWPLIPASFWSTPKISAHIPTSAEVQKVVDEHNPVVKAVRN